MCSVGDAFNIEIQALDAKWYKCGDCENEFRCVSVKTKIECPSCHSVNVSKLYKEQ
ncbi:Uncharacterised protein [uncultured archaeon]|nr:Uncharacterised protein [uncultured archaeon]